MKIAPSGSATAPRAMSTVFGSALIALIAVALIAPALARASAGELDPSFATGGIAFADFGGLDETAARSVAIDARGRIVTSGFSGSGVGVIRYLPDGSPDPSFGTNGVVTDDGHFAGALAVDSRNRILIAGDVLTRYRSTGEVDASFGGGAVALPGMEAFAMAIDSRGRIVVAGRTPGDHGEMAVARYLPSGTLDSSFGTGGVTTTGFGGQYSSGSSLTIDSTGRIVVAGLTRDSGGAQQLAIARYGPGGTLDASFGNAGRVTSDLGSFGAAVAMDPRGRVIVADTSFFVNPNGDFLVAAFEPDGTPARSFGDRGAVITDVGGKGKADSGNAVAIDSQGRIVAGGFAGGNDRANFALVRYNPDGSLDRSFANDGISVTQIAEAARPFVNSLAIASNGAIVAAGGTNFTHTGAAYEFLVARYIGSAPPIVSITSGPADRSSTNDPTPGFRFSADEFGSMYQCRVDGSPFGGCASPYTTSALTEGRHRFAVRAIDLDGLTGDPTSTTFRIDTTSPRARIRGHSKLRTRRRRARAEFRLKSSERVRFRCKVDSKAFHRCSSPYKTPRLGLGRHRLRIKATDAAGNTGRAKKRFRIVARR
jgi:uncharacterized delta-60 repeat protein